MNVEDAVVLDHAVLAELRAATGDDAAFIAELVAEYVREGAANMEGLVAAAAAEDCPGIVRPAHTLKSTSATLGAMRLSAICRAIEEAGRESRAGTLRADAELARDTWHATLSAFAEAGLRG
jgi:HPt (histidine-containing phosphotransfer) domain-containing protein